MQAAVKPLPSTGEIRRRGGVKRRPSGRTLRASRSDESTSFMALQVLEVSTKYLMDRVSSLGKLMAMDKSSPEFEWERQKLQNSCDEAQKGILCLALKNKEEFEEKSAARQEKIDRELLAILPAAPPEETKRIQEAVQAGFSEDEAASYY